MNPQQNNNPQVILPGQSSGPVGAQPQMVQGVGSVGVQTSVGQPQMGQPQMGQAIGSVNMSQQMGQNIAPINMQPQMPQNANPVNTQPQMTQNADMINMQAQMGQGINMTGAQPQMANPTGMQLQAIGAAATQAQAAQPISPNKENPLSTQATVLISELRDNVVIMKDGSFRAVVACKSINFDLMSEMEREGVEQSYKYFLNSLKFMVQILVRSQRVDIGPYIERLSEIRRNNDNMLLGVLMDDYINFIDVLSQEANIMDKTFFIVIPYYSSPSLEKDIQSTKNFFKVFARSNNAGVSRIDRETYNKALVELDNRVDSVISGLFQIGIHSVRLDTKELAELYYNFNNPDTAVREPLVDFSKVATLYVKKKEGDDA